METPKKVGLTILLLIMAVVLVKLAIPEINYTKSTIDGKEYLVRNADNKQDAANMLAKIRRNIDKLSIHLASIIDKLPEYREYIEQLERRIKNMVISESSADSKYTSYSVNKGDEIVFCLRSKRDTNKLHDMNLVMYVALHELAHVACPEFGHTLLFRQIFQVFTMEAMKIGIYSKIDFPSSPVEYCGMTISESIV